MDKKPHIKRKREWNYPPSFSCFHFLPVLLGVTFWVLLKAGFTFCCFDILFAKLIFLSVGLMGGREVVGFLTFTSIFAIIQYFFNIRTSKV